MLAPAVNAVRARWSRVQRASPASGHVIFTAGTNIAIAALTLVTGTLAARLLGPAGRGELAAIQTWSPFIASIAGLGLTDALVYFSAREPRKAGQYLGTAVSIALLSSLPFLIAGYVVMPYLLAAQSQEIVDAARLYLLIIPMWAVVWMSVNPLRGLNELVAWNSLRITQTLAWLAVLLLALLWTKSSAEWLTRTHLVTMLFVSIPVFIVVRSKLPPPYGPSGEMVRPLLSYGIPAIGGTIPQILNGRLDQLLMAAFLPPYVLGLYVVGVAWSSASGPLISAVGNVVFPRVAAQADVEERTRTLTQASRLAGIVAVSIGVVLFAGTPVVIPLLFGDEFSPAIPATLVLVGAGVFGGLNNVIEEAVRGLGHPEVVLWAETAGLVTAAFALALLLPRFGIVGAAVASLFSYAVTTGVLVQRVVTLTQCTAGSILLPRPEDLRLVRNRLRLVVRGS